MKLGESTNTHDINGEVLLKREVPEDFFERAKSAISEFKGDIFQTEPRFCAVKRDDSPLYEVVDTGEHQSFLGHVYRFSLLEQDFSQEDKRVGFSVVTSKNVLPRTLINDFGEAVGCGAALSALRRTKIGKFSVDEAVKFEKLLEIETRDFVSCTMPLSIALR
jgi:tRNA pseudouridine55 synthase